MDNSFLEKFKEKTKEEVSKLTYKKYFYQYNEQEKLRLASDMKDIEKYFREELELDIYPIYGTLLGMIRDNDFIGWDTDVDMAYMSKCHTNKAVLNEFNLICKFLEEKKLLMTRIKTASHLHVYAPSKYLRIDLWISWIDNNGKYHLVWTISGEMDSSVILPFKTIEFKNQKFNLINQPEKYLDEAYHNWKTPLDGNETVWKKKPFIFELEPWHGK
jgi:phosphorylcholine metabolism protein LicD